MRASASLSSAAACSCSCSGGVASRAPARSRMQLCRSSSSSSAAVVVVALAPSTSTSTSTSTFSSSRRHRSLSFAPTIPQQRHRNNRSSNRSGVCAPVAVFTGIVQGTATVSSVERKNGGGSSSSSSSSSPGSESAKFTLQFPPGALAGVTAGGSIAINGTCLTVVSADEATSRSTFDVVGETLRVTSLGRLEPGSRANFERAARVGDEIGGHLVSGHVCCVARVEEVEKQQNGGNGGGESGSENNNWNENASGNVRMRFRVPARWGKYILPKGFVSLDGCSLTVGADVETEKGAKNDGEEATTLFSIFFIPETLRVTRFGEARVGDLINVEVDATTQAVVDAVERAVDARIEERLGAKGL